MNYKEINKAIAHYMAIKNDDGTLMSMPSFPEGTLHFGNDLPLNYLHPEGHEHFDEYYGNWCDWAYLIPVWLKLRKLELKNDNIIDRTFNLINSNGNTEILIETSLSYKQDGETKYGFYYNTQFDSVKPRNELESVYLAIFRLITWLNETQKT